MLFLGTATGFGAYSLWYGNALAVAASSGDPHALLRRRVLHQLSSACGTALLVLLFSFGNLLVLLQPAELTRLSRGIELCLIFRFSSEVPSFPPCTPALSRRYAL